MLLRKPLLIISILAIIFQECLSQTGVPNNRKFLFVQQDAQQVPTEPNQAVAVQPQAPQAIDQTQQAQQLTDQNQLQVQAQNSSIQPVVAAQQESAQVQQDPQQQVQPQQQGQQLADTPSTEESKEEEEKNLMLVVPFSKEQFEAEMKMQSLRLQDESKRYYEKNLETLKNITIENKKIIDQKKGLIKLYLNHTTSYLDSLVYVLQRELEQNHETMLILAQAVILTTLDNYEQKISLLKVQIEEILVKVQPPHTICKKIMECSTCAQQQECVWSPDRRACFVGSKFDGCYFDYCEFFLKDLCTSNAKVDREDQVQLDHYSNDENLAQIMDDIYGEEEVELAAQRIPQPQKNYYIQLQNKLINIKDKIERLRIYINYIKKLYFKLRYQNIIFKRKRKKQKEEDLKFQQEIQQSEEDFLKKIKETEEEKRVSIDDLIKNEKALEKQKHGGQEKPFDEKLKIKEDGSIILSNGEKLEGLRVIDGQVIDESSGEVREDLKFVNGRLVGEDGKPYNVAELKEKLADEENFIDNLLDNWFGNEYQPSDSKLNSLDLDIIEKEKDPTVVDVDSDEIENEEQTILQYIANQVKEQKELEKQEAK